MPQTITTEPLAQMLKSIAHQERTGILRVEQLGERNAGRGELYFEKGRLIRAYCGQETGRAAVEHISGWKRITCSFHGISRPLPITTRILAPSRERTEEKPPARLPHSTRSRTENLCRTSHRGTTEPLKEGRRRPEAVTDKQPRFTQAVEADAEAEAGSETHPHGAASAFNQPLVLHGERLEEFAPAQADRAARTGRRWTTHADPARQGMPRRPPHTPRLGPLPGEEILPGRTAIFKARPMVATAQAIQRLQRRERIIFILLDGRRTIQDIAHLTHQPESEVEQTLVHLTKSGYTQYIQG